MECLCKACGKNLSTERRPLKGQPYSGLFDLVAEYRRLGATDIHCTLASEPSYVCRSCHAALTKYVTIKDQLSTIKTFIISNFTAQHIFQQVSQEPRAYLHYSMLCEQEPSETLSTQLGKRRKGLQD